VSGYIGFVLLGMGLPGRSASFFSALTQNQIVAALITISRIACLLVCRLCAGLPGFGCAAARCSATWSFSQHFGDFIRGLVRTEAVAFYLAVTAICLDA